MRLLILQLIVFGSLPVTLLQPFVGLLVYSWLAYMRPQDMVWGVTPRLSLLVALAMLAGLVLAYGRERWFTLRTQTVLLIALGVWMGLSSLTAVDPMLAREWTIRMWKILLVAVLTTGLVRTHSRFRVLYLVIAGSLGFLGLKYGLFSVMRGGVRLGNAGSFADNNGLAMILVMGVPLLVGVTLTEDRGWIRWGSIVLTVFSVAAIFSTFSRGGLISLAVVAMILLARSGRPITVGVVAALALTGLLLTASEEFKQTYTDRATTISDYRQDASMQGRYREWNTAFHVFLDYPLMGVGPDNLQKVRNFYIHDGSAFLTTHNAYLQMLVACGLPAFLLYFGSLVFAIWRLEVLRRRSPAPWGKTYASMIQCSLIAYSVGGLIGDAAYYDLTYHLLAMTVSLELAIEAEAAPVTGLQPIGSATSSEWWRQEPAGDRSIF